MGTNTKGVLTFLLISFGLAWGAIFLAYGTLGMSMADPLTQLTVALPMAFSPAIAAVVVRRWVTREGFGDAGLAPRVRGAWFYYLLAWVGPVLMLAVTVGLAAALGLYGLGLSALPQLLPGLPPGLGALPMLLLPIVVMPLFWGRSSAGVATCSSG